MISTHKIIELSRQGSAPAWPVTARASLTVDLPAAQLWKALTDVEHWPRNRPAISRVTVTGDITLGSRFTWVTGKSTAHSLVTVWKPEREFTLVGRVLHIRGIHRTLIRPISPTRSEFITEDSMTGLGIQRLQNIDALQEEMRTWVADFARAAQAYA